MAPDDHDAQIRMHSGQADLLLERLEELRDELGEIGDEIIALLRDSRISPPTESPD